MLYLVATPIGNLGDFSFRAIEILKSVDFIFCEDTRVSRVLLSHYEIDKPLKCYHKFNEKKELDKILSLLKEGSNIALISDAGTPCLSDPGEFLIQACIEKEIIITSIPGPSSVMNGLILSGFTTHPFQFWGYLPKGETAFQEKLNEILSHPYTSVLFETPHRIEHFLKSINKIDPERKMALCREMTKKFETIKRGCSADLMNEIFKGEMVVVIEAAQKKELSLEDLLIAAKKRVKEGASPREAAKETAKGTSISSRTIYQELFTK